MKPANSPRKGPADDRPKRNLRTSSGHDSAVVLAEQRRGQRHIQWAGLPYVRGSAKPEPHWKGEFNGPYRDIRSDVLQGYAQIEETNLPGDAYVRRGCCGPCTVNSLLDPFRCDTDLETKKFSSVSNRTHQFRDCGWVIRRHLAQPDGVCEYVRGGGGIREGLYAESKSVDG